MISIVLFSCYMHWHWYRGPWNETLPGQLGLGWIAAVDGSKACSALLALLSLGTAIYLFQKKAYLQGCVASPTCLLSLLTIPFIT